jgi:hypothetical protein
VVTTIDAVHNPSVTLVDCTGMDLDRLRVYIPPQFFNMDDVSRPWGSAEVLDGLGSWVGVFKAPRRSV